jgi:hypothetical protein
MLLHYGRQIKQYRGSILPLAIFIGLDTNVFGNDAGMQV